MPQPNLTGGSISRIHELQLVYSGPSFANGIKIEHLITNLSSAKVLIQTIADVNFEHGVGANTSRDVKEIRVVIKPGSIVELIQIVFSNPELRSIVKDLLINLFMYSMGKKDGDEVIERLDRIEELIQRGQLNSVQQLCEPLETMGDKLQIVENDLVQLEVTLPDAKTIDSAIEEIENEPEDITEEKIRGYINAVNIDTPMRKFHPIDQATAAQLQIDLSAQQVLSLVGKPLEVVATVARKKGRIIRVRIHSYTLLQRNLSEF